MVEFLRETTPQEGGMAMTGWKGLILAAVLAGGMLLPGPAATAADATTLETVRERGYVLCGTGGSAKRSNVRLRTGMDLDYCRALAAAVTGEAERHQAVHLSASQRFKALRDGSVDVLLRATTWTLTRDATLGVDFVGVLFHDGQGFLARRSHGGRRLADFDGGAVCVEEGTTTAERVKAMLAERDLDIKVKVFRTADPAIEGFFNGRCSLITRDRGDLVRILEEQAPDPKAYLVLEQTISKEPLSVVVREGDAEWADIAAWVRHALVNAEELGITAANAGRLAREGTYPQRLLLGTEGDLGAALGLDAGWARRAIEAVGNYGEIYDSNMGDLERGQNALGRDGGLMFAPPLR